MILTAAALVLPAFGQATKVEAEAPSFDDLPSPQFSGGGKDKSFRPKDWLEIETKLKVEQRPEPASKTCERLTVKWYVAIKNPEKSGTYYLLTRTVEHVNVPLSEDVWCSVYLSPASIRRVTGSNSSPKSSVELVGFEVLVNGEKVAESTNKSKTGWWNTSSDKISRSDTVPLLSKDETPFALMWWDRYAEVAPRRSN